MYVRDMGRANRSGGLEKARREDFANWLHNKILANNNYDDTLRRISLRPEKRAMCYDGCDMNGF
jgi:hypothetical protein